MTSSTDRSYLRYMKSPNVEKNNETKRESCLLFAEVDRFYFNGKNSKFGNDQKGRVQHRQVVLEKHCFGS